MRIYTKTELESMDLNKAQQDVSREVYQATKLFDHLQFAKGKNAETKLPKDTAELMRQKVALYATELLQEHWLDTDAPKS